MLDDVIADQHQLAAQAIDGTDRDNRRAGAAGQFDFSGRENHAGVAPERLAYRRQREAKPRRTSVFVGKPADLEIGYAQVPGVDVSIAPPEP